MSLAVWFRVVVGGQDVAPVGIRGSVQWGRDTPDEQPAGAVASVTVTDPDGSIAAAAEILAPFDLYAVLNGREFQRFAGTVVDVAVDHATQETTIVASDELGRLARTYTGDVPWPLELDGARIERIMAAAGVNFAGAGPWAEQTGTWAQAQGTWRHARVPLVDAGTVQILPRDVDRQPVLELLHSTATDAGGVIWADRRGLVNYRDAAHRPAATETEIPARMFASAATFQRGTAGMVNRLTVTYGPKDAQQTVTVQDTSSVERYGMFDAQRTTHLADGTEAESLARQVVSWRRNPRWTTPELVTDTAHVADEDLPHLAWLLEAGVNSAFRLPGVAPPDPSGDAGASFVVEGGTDTFEGDRMAVLLACSNLRQTAPPTTWDDVPPADTWDDMPPGVPWFDADSIYPPAREAA